jgi:hypothetical protein
MGRSTVALLIVLIQGITACGGGSSAPATTTPTSPAPLPVQLATFTDSASGFSTTDVRDVQDQVVRFDTANNALIWAVDGHSFSGFPVSGNFVRGDKFFQVRFGVKDGERRAYFTEAVATTLCDVEVVNGQLSITPTTVHVPGT